MTGSVAEVASKYLDKGHQVYIEGQLRTRKWVDSATGQERYATEVFVGGLEGSLYSRNGAVINKMLRRQNMRKPLRAQAPIEDFNDDIPF